MSTAGEAVDIDVVDLHELLAESLGIDVGGSRGVTAMTMAAERLDEVVEALHRVLRPDQVLTSKTDRYNRARVPAPFPVHRWAERVPDAVTLPESTEDVAAVVRVANQLKVPIVPRDGGTGLTDGAVPLRHGIVVDVKRMNQIHEIDLDNRTCTVGTGINMLKLNEELGGHGLIYPDNPASYPCSLVGGRIGTSGWSLIGSRYGHSRDLVLSFDHVLPTGDVMHVGDGIGHKISKSSSGYQLKHLFMGHQGTLGIATRATLKLFPKPEAELSPFFAFDDYDSAYRCTGALARAGVATFAGAVLFDEWKVAYLRRDDEAYIPQPTDVKALVCAVLYGWEDEVRVGGKRLMRIARDHGARYLGDEISEGDWAARHDRYATPLHGRTKAGQVVPMSWHCEDASINYTHLPAVTREWHAIVADLRRDDRRVRRLGHVRLHQHGDGRRLPHRDRRRDLGATTRRRGVGAVGAGQARHRRRRPQVPRVDQRVPRLVPRGRGRPRAAGARPRLRRDARHQAGARPEQHHEPRQVRPRPGVRGPSVMAADPPDDDRVPPREQMTPPPPEQVSDVAITRFEHVFEVDPRLMERWVLQQTFPNWDTLRIMHSRHDHLDWMHRHFAERVVPRLGDPGDDRRRGSRRRQDPTPNGGKTP